MKLRYIKNLYWYDGPLLDLFVEDDGIDLYLATVFIETKEENIWIVRKFNESVEIQPGIGVTYDKDFWEFKKNKDEYFLMPEENIIQGRDPYDRIAYLAFDVEKMTDAQREELDFKFDWR